MYKFVTICDCIWENQPVSKKINYRATCGNSCSSTKTLLEIKKKKHVLLKDEASDWLQLWTKASSLDVKDKKGIIFFSLTGWFSQIQSHFIR